MQKKIFLLFFLLIVAGLPFTRGVTLVTTVDGDWYSDYTWSHAPVGALVLNYTNTYGSLPSWQVPLNFPTVQGVDHEPIVIVPDDVVHISVWVKTSNATDPDDIGNSDAGGRLGIDVYSDVGFQESRGIANSYVMFGRNNWTETTMDFTVPATYVANQGTHTGHTFTPDCFVIWLQTWSGTEYATELGTSWFANINVTVTHEGAPNPPTVEPAGWNPLLFLLGLAGLLFVLYEGAVKKR